MRSATLLLLTLVTALACTSCRSPESRAAPSTTPVCRECFDAVTAALEQHPIASAAENRVLREYTCPCCNTEMAVYIEGGVHMVRCGGCAKDGVAWNACHQRRRLTSIGGTATRVGVRSTHPEELR